VDLKARGLVTSLFSVAQVRVLPTAALHSEPSEFYLTSFVVLPPFSLLVVSSSLPLLLAA